MDVNYKLNSLNEIVMEKKLGKGAFSSVVLIYHKIYKKNFALKIINLKNFDKLDQLRNEINLQKKLDHPNIIKLYDYLEYNNKVYLLLEFAENGNLFNYIKNKRSLDIKESRKIFFEMLEAINFLHEKNIIHRDIKPENILWDSKNSIKLCDFGWSAEFFKLQKRNTFCGTLEYMAPEIFENKKYDNKVDIWSLGILFYEMLHGFSPFKETNFLMIYNKIKDGKIKFKKTLDKNTIKYILWMLNSNPLKRPDIDKLINSSYWKLNEIDNQTKFINSNVKYKSNADLLKKNSTKTGCYNKIKNIDKNIIKNLNIEKFENIQNKKDYHIREKYKNTRKKVKLNLSNNYYSKNLKEKLDLINRKNSSKKQNNNMILNLNIKNTYADTININIKNENINNKNKENNNDGFFTERIIKLKKNN